MRSGAVIELAADAYGEADGWLLFNVLVDATADEQEQMMIDWRVPNNPQRVGVVVAKVPVAEVANVFTAPSWFDDGDNVEAARPD